jgi:hypothetical protein
MEVLPDIDTAAIANSLSRVTKDFSFDPESFSKESNNLLSLIRNQIKAAVDSSKESLTTRDNKLKEILRKYEALLKDCKGYCNSFLQETEKMRVLLDQWKNAVLIEKSLEDVTFWLQTRLVISDEQLLMKIKNLLLDDGITSIKEISDLEDEQLDVVVKKMPIGKQKALKDKIAELKVDLQAPNQAQSKHLILLNLRKQGCINYCCVCNRYTNHQKILRRTFLALVKDINNWCKKSKKKQKMFRTNRKSNFGQLLVLVFWLQLLHWAVSLLAVLVRFSSLVLDMV